ncbi:MAG TPA: ISAs1 family transposase [Ktedonobacteraceae bacterium]|jgi:predicted transposase YbfD/YdcC
MQYTASKAGECTCNCQQKQFNIEFSDLFQAFASVSDPRRAQGRVYWLPSLLCLAVGAILCNCLSVLAIAEWAAGLSPQLRQALGLPTDRSPDQSTLHRLFRRLDPPQLSRALADYFEQEQASHKHLNRTRRRAEQAVAVDGKARKGQLHFETDNACTIHDIEAFCHEMGVVLAQLALDNQGGEAELTGAPKLVSTINWQGRILTGDALYCQVELCQTVLADGGDYLVVVRGNQPQLLEELEVLFGSPEMQSEGQARIAHFDYRRASTIDKGHGRIEERVAIASTDLIGYSRWPGLAQVVQLTRTWEHKGVTKSATRYLVTSLPPEEASVQRLMQIRRGHLGDWQIENSLHYVKDVTMGEDGSLIHVGAGGAVMSLLRSMAVSLLHRGGLHRIASALRANSQRPHQALQLMGLLNSSDA